MNDRERVSVGSQSQTEDNLLHETQADSSAFSRASQWQLIRWRFLKHRVAVIALGVLALLYLCALFAEFVAPYDPRSIDSKYTHAPPQRIRILYNGQLSLPYVFPVVKGRDPQTLATQYTENTNAPSRLRLFARGDSYRLWGMLESDIHLFGVKNGRFMP
ncbi:MAG: hypothetical protein OXI86_15020, partial [Candidatus Poribacteria bacterium]|nr:hypothetical protein [Candidatus Poribacteria bacterium]